MPVLFRLFRLVTTEVSDFVLTFSLEFQGLITWIQEMTSSAGGKLMADNGGQYWTAMLAHFKAVTSHFKAVTLALL